MTTLTLTDTERDLLIEVLEMERDNADDNLREAPDEEIFRERRATCIELLFRLGVVTLMDEEEDDRP